MAQTIALPMSNPGAAGPEPRAVDFFCCAGGASMGYYRAGFKVVGVDKEPQPWGFRYTHSHAATRGDRKGVRRGRVAGVSQGGLACMLGLRSGAMGAAPAGAAGKPALLQVQQELPGAHQDSEPRQGSLALAGWPLRDDQRLHRSVVGPSRPPLSDGRQGRLRLRAPACGCAPPRSLSHLGRGSSPSKRRQARQRLAELGVALQGRARCPASPRRNDASSEGRKARSASAATRGRSR